MMKSEIRDFEIFSSCTNYGAVFVSSQVLSLPLLRKNLCPTVPVPQLFEGRLALTWRGLILPENL